MNLLKHYKLGVILFKSELNIVIVVFPRQRRSLTVHNIFVNLIYVKLIILRGFIQFSDEVPKSSISNFPPKLVFLYFDSIYPESFRWHTCRENFSKAEACIREIISANATSLPDFTQLYDRAKLAVLNSMYRRPRTFFDLLHTRERIKTTIALVSIW